MRVTSVDMFSGDIEGPIKFSLQGSEPKAQYQIRTILGLDAEQIIRKFYGRSSDGVKRFNNFILKPRDIAMRVVLNPRTVLGETPSDIRDELYRTISANRTGGITLRFNSGASVVSEISGYISKFEVGYFNKLPEVEITVRCNDPMLRGINPVTYEDAELPSANPFTIPDTLSTAPHGFQMRVAFTGTEANLTIQDKASDPEWVFKVTPASSFVSGDKVSLSSEFSEKYLILTHSAVDSPIADAIEPMSIWPTLFPFPGTNSFYIVEDDAELEYLQYYPAYWGV